MSMRMIEAMPMHMIMSMIVRVRMFMSIGLLIFFQLFLIVTVLFAHHPRSVSDAGGPSIATPVSAYDGQPKS